MKKIIILCVLFALAGNSFGQKEIFDLTSYIPPRGWKKQSAEAAIQYSKEDVVKGAYCLITLYKAVPGTANSRENFDLAWTSIVKEMVTVSTVPEMQPVSTENGWETQTGLAPFESDGNKGVVVLVTATAIDKMVNLIMLTNTEMYEKEMTAFLESISLNKPAAGTDQLFKPSPDPLKPIETNSIAKTSGFSFTTTNFDDGWSSTVKSDWVEVTKGTTRVLIHYPNKQADAYNSVVMDGLKNAWNILVAPRYSNCFQF